MDEGGIDDSASVLSNVLMYRWGKPLKPNKNNMDGFEVPDLINNNEIDPWHFDIPKSLYLVAIDLSTTGKEHHEVDEIKNDKEKLMKFILSKISKTSTYTDEYLNSLSVDFSVDESDKIAHEIKNKLELLVNLKLIPMLKEIDKKFDWTAKIFRDNPAVIRKFSHYIISDKLNIKLPSMKNDYLNSFGDNHHQMDDNPVTLAAIFCSMIKMMINFIKSDKEYLLWLQRKANIVNREIFIRLVEDCKSKQFDIVWLWTRKDDVHSKVSQYRHDHKLDISGSKNLGSSGLQYITSKKWNDKNGTLYGNTAVMMNKRMATMCIDMLLNSNKGYLKEDESLKNLRAQLNLLKPRKLLQKAEREGVIEEQLDNAGDYNDIIDLILQETALKNSIFPETDMFREDATLQQWAEYNSSNVGVVYAQEGHPIEYIYVESSYKKGGRVSTLI